MRNKRMQISDNISSIQINIEQYNNNNNIT